MLITTARHERIVAAKDAENAGLLIRLQHAEDLNRRYVAQAERLNARLAVFTAPRMRGEGGRFLPRDHMAAEVNLDVPA